MKTMKKFAIYFIAFVLCYIIVDIAIYFCMTSNYKDISYDTNGCQQTEVIVETSKGTKVNGYIEGKVTNKSNTDMEKLYLTLEGYSSYDNLLDRVTIVIEDLKAGESRDFRMVYHCNKVNSVRLSDSLTLPGETRLEEQEDMKTMFTIFGGTALLLKIF